MFGTHDNVFQTTSTEHVQVMVIVNCLYLITLSAIPKMKHSVIWDIDFER